MPAPSPHDMRLQEADQAGRDRPRRDPVAVGRRAEVVAVVAAAPVEQAVARVPGRCRPRSPAACPDPSRRRGSRCPRSCPGRRRRRCATPRAPAIWNHVSGSLVGTRPGTAAVGARPDVEVVGAVAAPEVVVAGAAPGRVDLVVRLRVALCDVRDLVLVVVAEVDPVVAGVAVGEVLTGPGVDPVVAVAAERDVVAHAGRGAGEGVEHDLPLQLAGAVDRRAEERLVRGDELVERSDRRRRPASAPPSWLSTTLPMSPTIASSSSLPSSQSLPSRP